MIKICLIIQALAWRTFRGTEIVSIRQNLEMDFFMMTIYHHHHHRRRRRLLLLRFQKD
jgi:FtsZ-interacting cell division protein ZipA